MGQEVKRRPLEVDAAPAPTTVKPLNPGFVFEWPLTTRIAPPDKAAEEPAAPQSRRRTA